MSIFFDPEQWESDAGWDTAHMMKNGCILIAHSRSRGMGLDYRDYYIKTADGRDALPDDGRNCCRAVLETDDGRCFVTDMNGNTDVALTLTLMSSAPVFTFITRTRSTEEDISRSTMKP